MIIIIIIKKIDGIIVGGFKFKWLNIKQYGIIFYFFINHNKTHFFRLTNKKYFKSLNIKYIK